MPLRFVQIFPFDLDRLTESSAGKCQSCELTIRDWTVDCTEKTNAYVYTNTLNTTFKSSKKCDRSRQKVGGAMRGGHALFTVDWNECHFSTWTWVYYMPAMDFMDMKKLFGCIIYNNMVI